MSKHKRLHQLKMTNYKLSLKPMGPIYGHHDQSAVIFRDGELVFGVEEERYTRDKHALEQFPRNAVIACLDHCDIELSDVDKILIPFDPSLIDGLAKPHLKKHLTKPETKPLDTISNIASLLKMQLRAKFLPTKRIKDQLAKIGEPVPPIEAKRHHECHAASAYYPTEFKEALVVTIDGRGEYDSTVVFRVDQSGFKRLRTYEYPNSLGLFYAAVTTYLGFYHQNGEGKVMGLAPYGQPNDEIESKLRTLIETGVDYDVTDLTDNSVVQGAKRLEELFDRPRRLRDDEKHFLPDEEEPVFADSFGDSAQKQNLPKSGFDQFEKDLAFVTQNLLEEIVTDIVERYSITEEISNVCLAGGVALNCKLNGRIRELPQVKNLFVQPVANDAGTAMGAGYLDQDPESVSPLDDVYLGESYSDEEIESVLNGAKIQYTKLEKTERYVAEQIADGALVGWFQGRSEMGPRALGNRSILADPRTANSRDKVNKFVKHREEWRPFAPSLIEEVAADFLEDGQRAPFMIQAFDTKPNQASQIDAVVHPADATTRPQTVTETQNPRYHRLISEFGEITGVPVLLNTSFNDHAEPIVNTPTEALKDFYGMGLDLLVIEDYVVEK